MRVCEQFKDIFADVLSVLLCCKYVISNKGAFICHDILGDDDNWATFRQQLGNEFLKMAVTLFHLIGNR